MEMVLGASPWWLGPVLLASGKRTEYFLSALMFRDEATNWVSKNTHSVVRHVPDRVCHCPLIKKPGVLNGPDTVLEDLPRARTPDSRATRCTRIVTCVSQGSHHQQQH